MLPPLDTRVLSALLREVDVGEVLECDPDDHIAMVKQLIAEDSNWPEGVMMLLELWPRTRPRFYRKNPLSASHPLYRSGGPNNWWIDLNNVFFGILRLKPSSGGVINIYAFGERVQSFQIMGCRQNWVAMLSWIWDYANKLEPLIQKIKASNLPAKANGQGRRVEKHQLHQVLHTAKFKAQHGGLAKAKAKELAVTPENTDSEMHDVDASSTTTDTAKPCGNTRSAIQPLGMSDDHRAPDPTVVGIDIEALDLVDHDS